MALPRLDSHTSARQIPWFVTDYDDMDLESCYQRGVVWGEDRQQALIKSFLMEYPIPAIIVNDRFSAKFNDPNLSDEMNMSYGVIDGKQRITAIRAFIESKFSVPREWFDEDYIMAVGSSKMITYADLDIRGQRFFRQRSIPVVITKVSTMEEEAAIFETINTAGLNQGASDF